MLKTLTGFHNRVARSISRMGGTRDPVTGEWFYPPVAEALDAANLYPLSHYIAVRQEQFVDRVATRPILALCQESERLPGSASRLTWWTRDRLQRADVASVDEAEAQE